MLIFIFLPNHWTGAKAEHRYTRLLLPVAAVDMKANALDFKCRIVRFMDIPFTNDPSDKCNKDKDRRNTRLTPVTSVDFESCDFWILLDLH
jgi:hypothetical protein